MIIGINGYAGSGKDTVGTIIQYLKAKPQNTSLEDVLDFPLTHQWWLEDISTWEIKKWAGKLKAIASMLTGIPQEKFEDQEFKKTNLEMQWSTLKMKPGKRQDGIFPKKIDMNIVPMTVRDFLQKLGTDAIRDGLHTNAWVNALMSDYKKIDYNDDDSFESHRVGQAARGFCIGLGYDVATKPEIVQPSIPKHKNTIRLVA